MIYIKNNTELQAIYIDRCENYNLSAGTLTLKNNTDKREYAFDVADDYTSRLFYHVAVSLPEGMPDGEYSYELIQDNNLLSIGLFQIGDYVPEKQEYITENNGYKQYNG